MKWLRLIRKLKPYNIQKGLRYLKHYGVKEFLIRLSERMEPEEVPYGPWREQYCVKEEDLVRQRNHRFSCSPKISVVVPAYRTPEVFLRQMIESLEQQSYPNWELVIGNASPEDETMARVLKEYTEKDTRVKNILIPENIGIAENTNAALAAATGEFVGFMDHDDLLSADALFEIAIRLEKDRPLMFFIPMRTRYGLIFPNISSRISNRISIWIFCDPTIISVISLLYAGKLQKKPVVSVRSTTVRRIMILFSAVRRWQEKSSTFRGYCTTGASTADNPASKLYAYEAGKKAIEGNLLRCGETGTVTLRSDYGFYDVEYQLQGTPLVSILIPNKDQADTLRICIESIRKKCTYPAFEILVIENNSTEEATFSYYKELEVQGIRVLQYPKQGFNYSAINNFGVREAKGEYLLFLNNDMEVITPDFMEKMVSNLQRPQIGAVGAKLYYPDNTVQHAGIILGIGGIAGHAFLGLARGRSGYLHKASLQMNVSAVTAACMMMKKEVFEKIGGFEEELSVAFNDVDLCLRIGKAGYKIVYNPHVELYHYESKSRGAEDDEKKVRRFQSEIEFMRSRWIGLLKAGDPCYNPNLTLASWNYGLRADGRGVKPWTK